MDLALLHGSHEHHILVGHVADKTAILVDNIADSCITLISAADVLRNHGATRCIAVVTHGLFGGDALERVEQSWIERLAVANTLPLTKKARRAGKVEEIDISVLLAEAIRRVHNGES